MVAAEQCLPTQQDFRVPLCSIPGGARTPHKEHVAFEILFQLREHVSGGQISLNVNAESALDILPIQHVPIVLVAIEKEKRILRLWHFAPVSVKIRDKLIGFTRLPATMAFEIQSRQPLVNLRNPDKVAKLERRHFTTDNIAMGSEANHGIIQQFQRNNLSGKKRRFVEENLRRGIH